MVKRLFFTRKQKLAKRDTCTTENRPTNSQLPSLPLPFPHPHHNSSINASHAHALSSQNKREEGTSLTKPRFLKKF